MRVEGELSPRQEQAQSDGVVQAVLLSGENDMANPETPNCIPSFVPVIWRVAGLHMTVYSRSKVQWYREKKKVDLMVVVEEQRAK